MKFLLVCGVIIVCLYNAELYEYLAGFAIFTYFAAHFVFGWQVGQWLGLTFTGEPEDDDGEAPVDLAHRRGLLPDDYDDEKK